MPAPGFRLRGAFRSCHACRVRKVRCIYPEGQDSKTCERCRDAGVQCIPAAKATRKSNWRRSVDEAIAQRAPTDPMEISSEQGTKPLPAGPQDLPPYIKPMPASLTASAITYLQQEGVFTIPSDNVRDAILECFFEFYHPSLPLIDPSEFADSIAGNNGRLSLLLLQAILFIGSTYLDPSFLRQLGCNTNKEARRIFFDRARLLHECDCEEDQYTSAQALVCLSSWFEPTERKETSYWLGCAISAMLSLTCTNSTYAATKANKRLWWSCYIRDRYLTWSARRPLRLHPGNSNMPDLTLEDFGIEKSVLAGSRFIKSPEDWQENALICLEIIKFYATISELILLRPGMQEHRAATDFAAESPANTLLAVFMEHLKWSSRLPENLQYYSSTGRPRSRGLTVQVSLMHLIYWTSVVESCEILPKHTALSTDILSTSAVSPMDLMNHAIGNVHSIFQDLEECRMVPFLSLAGVVVLCRCIAPLIRQLGATPSLNTFTSARCLAELMDRMQPFRSIFTIAEHIFKVFCIGLRNIILRDVTQVLYLDKTDLAAWNNVDSCDSPATTNKLYNNIRLLLLRLDSQDCTPSLFENTYQTHQSSSPSASGSGSGPGSGSGSVMGPRSESAHTPDSTHIKFQFNEQQPLLQPSSLFPEQSPPPQSCHTSDFLMAMDIPVETDLDARNLMSTHEFEDFCSQFGFQEDMGMPFSRVSACDG